MSPDGGRLSPAGDNVRAVAGGDAATRLGRHNRHSPACFIAAAGSVNNRQPSAASSRDCAQSASRTTVSR
jgi:hypothetical protein